MNIQTAPDIQAFKIYSVSFSRVYILRSSGLLGIYYVPRGAGHLQGCPMYHHKDLPDDQHHPVDSIPEKRKKQISDNSIIFNRPVFNV